MVKCVAIKALSSYATLFATELGGREFGALEHLLIPHELELEPDIPFCT